MINRIILFISLVTLGACYYFFFYVRSFLYGSISTLTCAALLLTYAIKVSADRLKNSKTQD